MSEHWPKEFCITIDSEGGKSIVYTDAPFTLSITRNGQHHPVQHAEKPGGFLTNYRIAIRTSTPSGERALLLIIDDAPPIPLRPRDYLLLKTLAQQMLTDGAKPGCPPEKMGWVQSSTLKALGEKSAPGQRANDHASLESNAHTKRIFAIRGKLARKLFSKDLLEYKDHAYRLSTPPVNIKLDPN